MTDGATIARSTRGRRPARIEYRPAELADLGACARVWSTALSDYLGRLGQPTFEPDLEPIRRLFAHLLETDPERFWVATRPSPDDRPAPGDVGARGERVVGFTSATVRGDVWFLGMLFVDPAEQATGIGRALLDRVMAGTEGLRLGTATDSAQPISNALYARVGIVPRLPALHLAGLIERPGAIPPLPAGVEAVGFGAVGPAELSDAFDRVDGRLLGYTRPADHAGRAVDGRVGVLFRDARREPVGYGYTTRVGRVGPVAALRPEDLAAFVGHLLGAVKANGAQTVWVPGAAGHTIQTLLRAGFRLEPFPALLCWTRPIAPFDRYVPISLALP
ncbi:MAG TPA: GNAT family N-acetyltransferase [Candidatus Dormibacteraeota bacterium]|nr:GNAT family N-acetyltransferase [Candidatus Dormibacteraeota bacterium]